MAILNVKHKLIIPYHCQANGLAENFNRYIRTALRCHSDSENWFEHLGLAMLGIDASYNHNIQMSRAERLFGKTLELPSSFFTRSKANVSKVDDPLLLQNLMKLIIVQPLRLILTRTTAK